MGGKGGEKGGGGSSGSLPQKKGTPGPRGAQGCPWARAHWRTSRCPPRAASQQRVLLNFSRTGLSRTPSAISARATLAATSAQCVRVTFPGGRGSSPTAAPAAAQLRHTSRNHRRSPAGTARATASRSSGGSPPAQSRVGAGAGPPLGPPAPPRAARFPRGAMELPFQPPPKKNVPRVALLDPPPNQARLPLRTLPKARDEARG